MNPLGLQLPQRTYKRGFAHIYVLWLPLWKLESVSFFTQVSKKLNFSSQWLKLVVKTNHLCQLCVIVFREGALDFMQKDLKHIWIWGWSGFFSARETIFDGKHWLPGQKCGQKSPRREDVGSRSKLRCSNLKPNWSHHITLFQPCLRIFFGF